MTDPQLLEMLYNQAIRIGELATSRADRNMRVILMFGEAMGEAIKLLESGQPEKAKVILQEALKGNEIVTTH